jgi:hypothetical protein
MNISIKNAVKLIVTSSFFVASIAYAAEVHMDGPDTPHMSTTQVKSVVKDKHKGKVIFIERKETPSHPNCHTVKMVTTSGEFRYIRYACGG